MNKKTAAYGAAATGVTAGVVGLVLLTVPAGAGAGPAPSLPDISPERLLQSAMQAEPTALHGTVAVQNELGLPQLPNLPQLANGESEAQVWTDGAGGFRAALPYETGERTFVANGNTFWQYNSADQTATKMTVDGKDAKQHRDWAAKHKQAVPTDPAAASREVISAIRQFSDVTVDGTSSVAGRDAYQLVLTPKPTERTLLREVRVAVDSEKRLPLQLDVFTNGAPEPALRVGYSDLEIGPQDPAQFRFTPPEGTTVTTPRGTERSSDRPDRAEAKAAMEGLKPKVVGSGWDMVLVANLPDEALGAGQQDGAQSPQRQFGPGSQFGAQEMNPTALLRQFGREVSGEFGKGWVFNTKVGTALVTEDGRAAAGFVPEQVLTNTLASTK